MPSSASGSRCCRYDHDDRDGPPAADVGERGGRVTELRRAIAHAETVLGLSHDTALLLPVRVVRDLWEEKQRTEAAMSAASRDEREDRTDGKDGDR